MRSMNQLCWAWVMFVSSPKVNLKGRHCISASKSKSAALVSGLGPNTGFALESGGDIPMDVASTCSIWTVMVLGITGRNDISTSSPFISMLALCSTWWYFTMCSSVANKGCHNQMFCLVVLINIIGMDLALVLATHLFTIMSRSRLWCSACSTRHATFGGILFVCSYMVITAFLGMQTGFLFEPTVTCPICLVLLPKFCWSFFSLWGFYLITLLGHSLGRHPQPNTFTCVWIVVDTKLGDK